MTDDISKLPKWAQQLIKELSRERDVAITQLNEYLDDRTESEIFIDDYVSTGENQGPTSKRNYIQGHTVTFVHAGVELDVSVFYDGYIDLKWGPYGHHGYDVALIPWSHGNVHLVSKDSMD